MASKKEKKSKGKIFAYMAVSLAVTAIGVVAAPVIAKLITPKLYPEQEAGTAEIYEDGPIIVKNEPSDIECEGSDPSEEADA